MRNTNAPDVTAPRALVMINDEAIPGWVEWTVDNNTFYQADTFRVVFATDGVPTSRGPAWFSAQSGMKVEIRAGFPADPVHYGASELDSLIYGAVDDLTWDPVHGTVELSGRDLTAELIDTKTTEKWPNLTASQIVERIAKGHGLTPVVTKTTQKSGKYYEIDHVRLTDQRSEWDLLTWLAHEEQFIVYVKGKELHFEPKPTTANDPYVLTWQPPTDDRAYPIFNGKGLTLSRNLTLAKDVIVEVRSWNAKNAKGFTVKAQATHNKNTVLKGAAQPVGDAQTYSYTVPGLTHEAALKWAQAKLREITQHEMRLSVELPGDNILRATDVVELRGTGTAFDQTYFPESVVRQMSISAGYSMTLTAKNQSPESVIAP